MAISYFEKENYRICLDNLNMIFDLNNINDILKQRIIIDSCHVFKKQIDSKAQKEDDENENKIILEYDKIFEDERNSYELIINQTKYLDRVMKKTFLKELYYESFYLRKDLYDLIKPDIIMLNSNPLKNNSNYINSNPNNQYYILNQLKKDVDIFIKIKAEILNYENLNNALNGNGKILIIQSDDFTIDGEIVCESENGESEILLINKMIDLLKKFDSKEIKYKAIILCFPNSSKLIKYFNNKVDYLITFNELDFSDIEPRIRKKYNKLSAQFIIDFIKCTIYNQNENIDFEEFIFNNAKINFESKLNDDKKPYIKLTKKADSTANIKCSGNNFEKEIFLYEPLIKLNENEEMNENNNYSENIYELIEHLNNENNQIFYCREDNKKKYTQICLEVMKYFHRHKTFCELYYIDIEREGKRRLKSIIRKLNKMWIDEINELDDEDEKKENEEKMYKKMCFILINNCKWRDLLEVNIYSILNCNSSFIILYDDDNVQEEINVFSNESFPENDGNIISVKLTSLGENKIFLLQYSEPNFNFLAYENISSDFYIQYPDISFNEKNIKRDLLNYKLDIIKNGNLYQYIYYGNPLEEEQTKFIFYKILKCVEILHDNNYCHLDIELGNIMLDEGYNPILLNLGTGRKMKENLNDFDGIITEYTPPELEVKDNNFNYDGFKVDIFSLGILLYKLTTGKKPSDEEDINLSVDFKKLFYRMVAEKPEDRYSLKDVFDSDWMKKTTEMFNKKDEEFKSLEKKVKNELEKKRDQMITNSTQINVNEEIDTNLPHVDNSFLNNPKIEEVGEEDVENYNIIMIPENINQIELINILYNRLQNDKVHYNLDYIDNNKYAINVEFKKEENDQDYNDKRTKLSIELYKVVNEEQYFFRINNIGKTICNLDDFYESINKIKKSLDNIIENSKNN